MLRITACVVLIFFFVTLPVTDSKAMTLEKYKSASGSNNDLIKAYLAGVYKGFFFSNEILNLRKENQFYCLNSNLQLNSGNIIKILEDYLKTEEGQGLENDFPVELALLNGLQNTFPCDYQE